jgi:release factor glutamine methyltransferase
VAEAAAPTARTLATDAISVLAAAGVENPSLDAQLLLAHAAGTSRERLLMDRDRVLTEDVADRFEALVARRAQREPVAYILGRKAFRHITLTVDRRVLIPRPETEVLVDVGLTLHRGARVVDVGTGSGALALALKHERPDLDVWATDVSADALAVARENARTLRLAVEFVHGDLLDGVPEPIDAVLSNLPYVALDYELPPEISRFEPPGAVFGGPDGLAVIRLLIATSVRVPLIALEIGFDLAVAVAELLEEAGFQSIEVRRDLAGHDRVVLGRR